jgi:hypothetical protein
VSFFFIKLNIYNEISIKNNDICSFQKTNTTIMGMNKNTILGWATFIMILMGLLLIGLGAFRYDDVAGWGFAAVGIGFLANAWVFSSLKGRV